MSPLRFFTAEDPDMARVRAIRRQVFVQDLGVPEQQEFDAADLPGADTVYALLTAESNPLGTGRLQGAAENYKIGRIAFLPAARGQGSGRQLVTAWYAGLWRKAPFVCRWMPAWRLWVFTRSWDLCPAACRLCSGVCAICLWN